MSFEDRIKQHEEEQLAVSQFNALHQASEARGAREEQIQHEQTWRLVEAVRDKLVEEDIPTDARMLKADEIETYNQRRRNAEYANPIFRGMTRMKARKATFLEDNAVSGWKISKGMYLGEDGVLYDMRKRGMTKEEQAVGVFIAAAWKPGAKLKKPAEYEVLQKGLAGLVSRSGVQWP